MKEKNKLVGILMILLALLIGGMFIFRKINDKQEETVVVTEKKPIILEEPEEPKEESEDPVDFQLEGVTNQLLETFKIEQKELASMVSKWCMGDQKYSLAIGAEFYSDEIKQVDGKYQVLLRTIVSEEYDEKARHILVFTYDPVTNQYQIHP